MLAIAIISCFFLLASSKTIPNNHRQKRLTKCYGDLGCFSSGGAFTDMHRPLSFVPASPQHINTQFLLYTRQNQVHEQKLKEDDITTIASSNWDPKKKTIMVSHGFIDNGFVDWMKHMKDEFLINGDYNVINIDWGGGSSLPYTQATANTRVVGAVIAKLIKQMIEHFSADPMKFHVIGHSLGAHVAGYAGERVHNLGRITGLDPAEPYFQYTDISVRLDPTDAQFVDIIHTDGITMFKLGYGMIQPCGHVDYFPNGGETQPGCDKDPVSDVVIEGDLYNGMKQFVACNHLRAYALFSETINSHCPFEGYECPTYDNFRGGKCVPCSGKKCGRMGFYADTVKPAAGQTMVKYYLNTGPDKPFCRYHYNVRIDMSGPVGHSERGDLFLTLYGASKHTSQMKLNDDKMDFAQGKSYNFVVINKDDIGQIMNLEMKFQHHSSWTDPFSWNPLGINHPRLTVRKIDVVSAEVGAESNFCGPAMVQLDNGKDITVQKSDSCQI